MRICTRIRIIMRTRARIRMYMRTRAHMRTRVLVCARVVSASVHVNSGMIVEFTVFGQTCVCVYNVLRLPRVECDDVELSLGQGLGEEA